MKILVTIVLGLMMLPSSGIAQTPPPAPYHYQRTSMFDALKIGKKDIVFIGNSITNGCEWAELFNNRHVKNRGINADKSFDVLARIGQIVEGHPKRVFLMIGTNDLAAGYTPESVVANIAAIADRFIAESPHTKLYVQSILPVTDEVTEMYEGHRFKTEEIKTTNLMLEKMCHEKGVTYIDVWSALADEHDKLKKEYTNDGLHLMMAGYSAWKRVIEPYVK